MQSRGRSSIRTKALDWVNFNTICCGVIVRPHKTIRRAPALSPWYQRRRRGLDIRICVKLDVVTQSPCPAKVQCFPTFFFNVPHSFRGINSVSWKDLLLVLPVGSPGGRQLVRVHCRRPALAPEQRPQVHPVIDGVGLLVFVVGLFADVHSAQQTRGNDTLTKRCRVSFVHPLQISV